MPAVKSTNRFDVLINQNFFIQVKEPDWKTFKLTTARKVINHLKDKKLKIKLFKQCLEGKKQIYTFKIRKRLILRIYSK